MKSIFSNSNAISAISILCSKQAASLFFPMFKRNKNVLFRSFCTSMYGSQSWWNFRKSCMQRFRVAYHFGRRALYNLPWWASVSSHQVQCNIPTYEALLQIYIYICFLNDAENRATYGCTLWCGQIVYIRPYLLNTTTAFYFLTVLGRCSVCLRACTCHNTFVLYLALIRVGLSVKLWM